MVKEDEEMKKGDRPIPSAKFPLFQLILFTGNS